MPHSGTNSNLRGGFRVSVVGVGNVAGVDRFDVAALLRPPFTAEFHKLDHDSDLRPPDSVGQARTAFLTYLGEGLSLARFNKICRSIEELLPANADFQFAMVERKAWTPLVLLTVFDP